MTPDAKKCSGECKRYLTLESFYKGRSECKECFSKKTTIRLGFVKGLVETVRSEASCTDCGARHDGILHHLEFDHKEGRKTKKITSYSFWRSRVELLRKELRENGEWRCRPCHQVKTSVEQRAIGKRKRDEIEDPEERAFREKRRALVHKYVERNRAADLKAKLDHGLKCAHCGLESENPASFEWDYVGDEPGHIRVGWLIGAGYSLARIQVERLKCVLACRRCNALRGVEKIAPVVHEVPRRVRM